jgi:hypothetical protein
MTTIWGMSIGEWPIALKTSWSLLMMGMSESMLQQGRTNCRELKFKKSPAAQRSALPPRLPLTRTSARDHEAAVAVV